MEKCRNMLSATSTSQQVHMCSVLEQTRPQFCASATVRCNAQTTWTCVVCRSSHSHIIKLSATDCHMHMCIVSEQPQSQHQTIGHNSAPQPQSHAHVYCVGADTATATCNAQPHAHMCIVLEEIRPQHHFIGHSSASRRR